MTRHSHKQIHKPRLAGFCLAIAAAAPAIGAQDVPQADHLGPVLDATRILDPADASWGPVGSYFFPAVDIYEKFAAPQRLALTSFPLSDDLAVDLELERFYAYAIGAEFVIGTDAGDIPAETPRLATYRGVVSGIAGSWVVIGVTPERIYGIIQLNPREEYWIAPPPFELAGFPHVVFERIADAVQLNLTAPVCDTETPPNWVPEEALLPDPNESEEPGGPSLGFPWRVVDLALEGDFELRQKFPTPQDAIEYEVLLAAVVSQIYQRDMEVKIAVSFARAWDTINDPYDQPDTERQLPQFQSFWNNNMGHVTRTVAHLLSGRGLGGGRAFLRSVCDSSAYGVNAVGGPFPYPMRFRDGSNFDIYVLAHEMGHNLGTAHTHCYDPPIDTCAGPDFDCPHEKACPVGTIMSYCHLCPGGVGNVNMSFHPRVVSAIRGFIDPRCPRAGRSPCHVDRAFNGNEQGTESQPYNTVIEGVRYVIPGATVLIKPGAYNERFFDGGLLNRAMRLERLGPSGVVRIGAP